MVRLRSEAETRLWAARVGTNFQPGDVVLLRGELGSGKTTFVRGYLESLGLSEPVRSPSFNLVQVFETTPPVMHADLYRVKSAIGIGIEDYLDTHVCLIEWPENSGGFFETESCWQIVFETHGAERTAKVSPPITSHSQ